MEESFVITRDYSPPSMGSALWAGFLHSYCSGDVALHLKTILENTPATRAGMRPAWHQGSIVVAINGERCYDAEEKDRDGQALRADSMFVRLTKGDRLREPFTLTIRQPTLEEVRDAFMPRLEVLLDAALEREWPLSSGILPGRALVQTQAGVQMLRRLAQIEAGDWRKTLVFVEELRKRGWQGTAELRLSFEMAPAPENEQELMEDIRAEFPEAEITIFRERMAAQRDALSANQAAEFQAFMMAAHPDVPATSGQDACVVCLSNARQVAVLHGATAHLCVCNGCAAMCDYWKHCPICRLPVDGTRQVSEIEGDAAMKVYGRDGAEGSD